MMKNSGQEILRHLSLADIEEYFEAMGEKKFRAKQVYEWLWLKPVRSFDEMTNLSKDLRQKLKAEFYFTCIDRQIICSILKTAHYKLRFKTHDGHLVEGVLIPTAFQAIHGLCFFPNRLFSLSCKFCATGYMDRKRNLDFDEIYDEVAITQQSLRKRIWQKTKQYCFHGYG